MSNPTRTLRRAIQRKHKQQSLAERYRAYARQAQKDKRNPLSFRVWREAELKAAGQLEQPK